MKIAVSAVLMLAFIVGFCSLCVGQGYANGYMAGKADGHQDCPATLCFLAGFFLGPIEYLYVLMSREHSPDQTRMLRLRGESDAFQEGYLDGYSEGWQRRRSRNALLGAATSTALVLWVVWKVEEAMRDLPDWAFLALPSLAPK